jgi:uncharacterized protein YdcH (DUF465 family)
LQNQHSFVTHTAHLFVYSGIMEAMREAWTDERLDDLRDQVDRRFDQVDARFDRVDRDIRDLRVELKAEMDSRFDRLDANLNGLQRTIIQVGGGLIGTVFVASAGLIATQL